MFVGICPERRGGVQGRGVGAVPGKAAVREIEEEEEDEEGSTYLLTKVYRLFDKFV